MNPALVALLVLLVSAVTLAVWARLEQTRPAQLAQRLRGVPPQTPEVDALFVSDAVDGPVVRLGTWLARLLPSGAPMTGVRERLAQAGFRTTTALPLYIASVGLLGLLGAVALLSLLIGTGGWQLIGGALGAAIGALVPVTLVARRREARQLAMRHGLPDMLDLMLICVEAGISLDAAILRVGRELAHVHPALSEELIILGRKQSAGVPREDALRGLWNRTGMPEFRTLAANIIQSERWGTSIARVLRVNAEVIRRTRRTTAEQRAAIASTKMLFPLALLILPALFLVIGGPVMLQLGTVFDALATPR